MSCSPHNRKGPTLGCGAFEDFVNCLGCEVAYRDFLSGQHSPVAQTEGLPRSAVFPDMLPGL